MTQDFLSTFYDPPREYSVLPFWFWNDDLSEEEIIRQIDDFVEHGVYGFVIHPRVGLPRSLSFMSDELMRFIRFAVDAAAERDLKVLLYDEAMYPSGSAGGLIVEQHPELANRCLAHIELASDEIPTLQPNQHLVAMVRRQNGQHVAVIDRPSGSYLRGIHLEDHDGPRLTSKTEAPEDEPPAADVLNPRSTKAFIDIVYEGFAKHLSDHFGKTIIGIFTDEPNPLGKKRDNSEPIHPGTTGILEKVNTILGEDFTPHLAALWYDDEPDAELHRKRYRAAIHEHMKAVYYKPLSAWCEKHGLALTGHPSSGDDIGSQRLFHIPGQDTVWQWVMPDQPSALEGSDSTQGKCTSSASLHLGRPRNANECLGAYGHELSEHTMKWLFDWLFVRGVDMLIPHAFYYSVRGPRLDERPPDVGPNNRWWDRYKQYADYCRRLSWLNANSEHYCHLAILGPSDHLPWQAAKVLFENQLDFNYLEVEHLWTDAAVTEQGIEIAGMTYSALVIDDMDIPEKAMPAIAKLREQGMVINYDKANPGEVVMAVESLIGRDISVYPDQPGLRVRHVVHEGKHIYMLCNESVSPITFDVQFAIPGRDTLLDPFDWNTRRIRADHKLMLEPYTLQLVIVEDGDE